MKDVPWWVWAIGAYLLFRDRRNSTTTTRQNTPADNPDVVRRTR